MNDIEPVRYADFRPMLVAGVRRTHSFADASRGIAEQWAALAARGSTARQVGDARYGVICSGDPDAETVDYLCGVEVESFGGLGDEVGKVRIPAAHYAVFAHRGGLATLGETWDAIFGGWLPRSGRHPAQSPDFELYDERLDPATGSGEIELWVPIEREAGA